MTDVGNNFSADALVDYQELDQMITVSEAQLKTTLHTDDTSK